MIPRVYIYIYMAVVFNLPGTPIPGLGNEVVQNLHNHLVVMFLLQPTDNNHAHHPIYTPDPDGKATTMNRIVIRSTPPIRTVQGILPHKRRLNLSRRAIDITPQHLAAHQPTRHSPAQHGIPLSTNPDLIIDDSAGPRGALKDDVWLRGGPDEGNGDEGGFSLVGG